MIASIKRKIRTWWQKQIKVLDVQNIESLNNIEDASQQSSLLLVLPRECYFETYKQYPVSVGADISKIVKVEGRQISPYSSSQDVKDDDSLVMNLILKSDEQYTVYYFTLLPKFYDLVSRHLPVFFVPETAVQLAKLHDGTSNSEPHFIRDENGVWLSQFQELNSSDSNGPLKSIKPSYLKGFFNPKILEKLSKKIDRFGQIKLALACVLFATLYYSASTAYLAGLDWYLDQKNGASRPLISQLFKVKDELSVLQAKQKDMLEVHQYSTELTGPLLLIEQNVEEFDLNVKEIKIEHNLVVLKAEASNANALLGKLLLDEQVSKAEFKSDIRKKGGLNSKEQFELEFVWEGRLWQNQ